MVIETGNTVLETSNAITLTITMTFTLTFPLLTWQRRAVDRQTEIPSYIFTHSSSGYFQYVRLVIDGHPFSFGTVSHKHHRT